MQIIKPCHMKNFSKHYEIKPIKYSLQEAFDYVKKLNVGPISCYYSFLSICSILLSIDVLKSKNNSSDDYFKEIFSTLSSCAEYDTSLYLTQLSTDKKINEDPLLKIQSSSEELQLLSRLEFNIQPWMFMTWIFPYFHERQSEYMFGNCHHMLYSFYMSDKKESFNHNQEESKRQKTQDLKKEINSQTSKYSYSKEMSLKGSQSSKDYQNKKKKIDTSSEIIESKVDTFFRIMRKAQVAAFQEIYGSDWRDFEKIFELLINGQISLEEVDSIIHLMYLFSICHVNYIQLVLLSEKELEKKMIKEYVDMMHEASYLFQIVIKTRKIWRNLKNISDIAYNNLNLQTKDMNKKKEIKESYKKFDEPFQSFQLFGSKDEYYNISSLLSLNIFIEKNLLPSEKEYYHWRELLLSFLNDFSAFTLEFLNYTKNRISKKGQTIDSITNDVFMWLSKQHIQSEKKRQQRIRRRKPRYSDLHCIPEEYSFFEHFSSEEEAIFWNYFTNGIVPKSTLASNIDTNIDTDIDTSLLKTDELIIHPEYIDIVNTFLGLDRKNDIFTSESKL